MLTVPEAAARTGLSAETIRRWIRSGRLRSRKVGTQHLIDEPDLEALTEDGAVRVPAGWRRTATGEPMPDVVAAVRRSRQRHQMAEAVVDASVAVNACLAEAGFEPLAGRDLVAPPLLWSEAGSAIHELRWRRAIGPELAELAFGRLLDAPIARAGPATLLRDAWAVADELGWAKLYDAEYVALARRRRCPLLTVDGRLRRTASRVVDVIGPTDA